MEFQVLKLEFKFKLSSLKTHITRVKMKECINSQCYTEFLLSKAEYIFTNINQTRSCKIDIQCFVIWNLHFLMIV